MSEIQSNVTGRKSGRDAPPSILEPLIVPVTTARQMLGGMSKNKFWKEAKAGKFELVGSERKRFVVVASLHRYVDRLARRTPTTA
jgi:hypothetical protein